MDPLLVAGYVLKRSDMVPAQIPIVINNIIAELKRNFRQRADKEQQSKKGKKL